ncbi:hypothetical protein [Alteromonas gilva]|uniref:Uncharacterized protein n=1 Tax=Alteromonas gilva TaxID=2987522 RepID=A0ABT5L1D1_9ALTE|nr:hypothetical protein [Alteromonas gilva]MDC8830276.1 hypothetical protein [Alteromonas gilva]
MNASAVHYSDHHDRLLLRFMRSVLKFFKAHYEIALVLAVVSLYQLYALSEHIEADKIFNQPQKSDFYFVDFHAIDPDSNQKYRYVPMKVLAVQTDGIVFKAGNIGHTTPVSPRQHFQFDHALTLRNYYRVEKVFVSHEKLAAMYAAGDIYTVRRPHTIYIDGWIVIHKHEQYSAE